LRNVPNDMFVVCLCVVIVTSIKARVEKSLSDAAGQGNIDVIRTLFQKDSVSKPVTYSLLILVRNIAMIFITTLTALLQSLF
jgi:hypothetical protein